MIENFMMVVSILITLWVVASFIDINMHNLSDYKYAQWNMFIIIDEHF